MAVAQQSSRKRSTSKSSKSKRRAPKSNAERFDVYEYVRDTIVAKLEEGVAIWRKPWRAPNVTSFAASTHRNFVSGKPYRGINVFLLDIAALENGYQSPYWLTFNQLTAKGGKLVKINADDAPGTGQKATLVTLWKPWTITEKDEATGEEKRKQALILKHFHVFNLDQTDLAPAEQPEQPAEEPEDSFDYIEAADTIMSIYLGREGAPRYRHAPQDRAYYSPLDDKIVMPEREQFTDSESYYSTGFHEMVHSTGHEKRLKRSDWDSFGSDPYAKEELVAEMGAAMLCAMAGIECRDESAGYIHHWLHQIKNADKRFVVQAASQAQKASDMILGEQPYENGDEEAK